MGRLWAGTPLCAMKIAQVGDMGDILNYNSEPSPKTPGPGYACVAVLSLLAALLPIAVFIAVETGYAATIEDFGMVFVYLGIPAQFLGSLFPALGYNYVQHDLPRRWKWALVLPAILGLTGSALLLATYG